MQAQAWAPPAAVDANTFRIFISTDNHLGYHEKHEYPPRQDDSFRAVEEVLKNATAAKSDILLMGGDLYHDHKPSRQCMVKSLKMFRRYVFGDRPVQVEPTSIKTVNDETGEKGYVNWEDENMNIGLPVFIIHGNHDDPTGQGNYSVLDELCNAGMVNYFGKQKDIQNMVIKPVILTKGTCKIAIYGIGNIKDERLHENFKKEKVHFEVPSPKEDYFHILVIHQNRAQKGVKNYIPTEMLPDFLNFIIWGHEHECRVKPEEAILKDGKSAHLTQPGSSCQTSYTGVEAFNKHMAYMDIQLGVSPGSGSSYRYKFKPVEHKCTRPFMYEEIILSNETDKKGDPIKSTEEAVTKFLEKKVHELVKLSEEEYSDRPEDISKPLIRLKVEHTGYPQIAPRRFGQLFTDNDTKKWAVANPFELLQFWRKIREGTRKSKPSDANLQELGIDREILEAPEINDLVLEELERNSINLEVLAKDHLFSAVEAFVDKEEVSAIKNMVLDQLEDVQKHFGKQVQNGGDLASINDDKELMDHVKKLLEIRQKSEAARRNASQLDRVAGSAAVGAGSSSTARGGHSLSKSNSIPIADSDDEEPSSSSAQAASSSAGGRGRARGRGAAAVGRGGARGGGAAGRGASAAGKTRQLPLSFGSQGADATSSKAASKNGAAKGKKRKAKGSSEDEDDDEFQQEASDASDDSQGGRGATRVRGKPSAKASGRAAASSKKTAVSLQQSSKGDGAAAGGRVSRARGNGAADDETVRISKKRRHGSSDEDDEDEPAATCSSAWGA